MPRVSVLLPAWNAADTLEACLASLHRQTEPDWEAVVVDDGSSDATARVVSEAALRDPRLAVVVRPHRGVVAALRAGLDKCRGTYVARMDADDVMRRDRLRAQADALDAAPSLVGVSCHVRICPRRNLTGGLRQYERWLNGIATPGDVRRDAFVECPVAHPTLMMRREALARLGYRDVPWPEDYDLVLRALAAGLRIGVVPRRLVAWRDGPSRLSRTDPRYAREAFAACKAHYLAHGFLARSDAYVLWGYGGTGRALRRALAAHARRPAAVVEVSPRRIGQRIHGAPVISPADLPAWRGAPIVVSVAHAGPRALVRAALAAMGFTELESYVCAA